MVYEVLDPADFLANGAFFQDHFIAQTNAHDWSRYAGRPVLIRGCSTTIPPWAYMLLTGKLVGIAKSVRYGNEHDNIVVYRPARSRENEE